MTPVHEEPARRDASFMPDRLSVAGLIERSVVLLLVAGLLLGVLMVLRPFATAILFGAMLAIAAWPLRQLMVRRGLGRGLTATLLLLLTIIFVALPVLLMAPVLTDHVAQGARRLEAYFASAPARPAWLAGVPLVGPPLTQAWDQLVHAHGNVHTALAPYSEPVRQAAMTAARALADSVVQVVLSLVVATMFWISGAALTDVLREIFRRLGGTTAEQALTTAAGAVRGVAYGVIGTAAIQAALLALGLAVAGVPGAVTLGFVALLLAVSQIGAPLLVLIWGGAAWWLFGQSEPGWGVFMIGWGLMISMIDNFLKPWLIGLGIHMPLSLILLGVFGGFSAFGFLGMFIGPTLIAVAFVLLQTWRDAAPLPSPAVGDPAAPFQPGTSPLAAPTPGGGPKS
jgi:predicted PurR-regulated permease PerM